MKGKNLKAKWLQHSTCMHLTSYEAGKRSLWAREELGAGTVVFIIFLALFTCRGAWPLQLSRPCSQLYLLFSDLHLILLLRWYLTQSLQTPHSSSLDYWDGFILLIFFFFFATLSSLNFSTPRFRLPWSFLCIFSLFASTCPRNIHWTPICWVTLSLK